MEVSVIGSSRVNLGRINRVGLCNFSRNLNACIWNGKNSYSKGCNLVQSGRVLWHSRFAVLSLTASTSAQNQAVVCDKASKPTRNRATDGTKLFVGLPLDTISSCNSVSHPRAIAAGLKALKLLGVDGVELPVWWGVAENEAMGKYDWRGYLAIAEMVENLDLELHVSLCFHASTEASVSLPAWVSCIGELDTSIYFTDRSGQQYKDCLSLGVDDLPVLDGKTPLQVYGDFFESFKSAFSPFIGSTITGLTVGLGPNGELRYPSHHQPKHPSHPGPGEFQCYDTNMLRHLKLHAETHGNPLWGLGGPHDAPLYDDSMLSGTFFADNGGSWESPYGDFFLSWYSNQLISHGDKLLSLAHSTFEDSRVALSGRIPLVRALNKFRSRPSELTAGFYNTDGKNGYGPVAEMFSRNSCRVVLPVSDLSDNDSWSSRGSGITGSCRKLNTGVSGENASVCGGPARFGRIKEKMEGGDGVRMFTYQRMGADLFSPHNFPLFTRFVRGLKEPALAADDLPVGKEEVAKSFNLQMQLV